MSDDPPDRIFSLEILLFSAKHLFYWVYRADLTKRLKEGTTDLVDPGYIKRDPFFINKGFSLR